MSMKVKVQIDRLCNINEIKPYRLAKETGLSHSLLWKLRHGKTKGIKFDVLEKICEVFGCEPNDVLLRAKSPKRARTTPRGRRS
jgi:putative transcriptional regulator